MTITTKVTGTANLDYVFNPESVAIVGISSNGNEINVARLYLEAIFSCNFEGRIYPVSTRGGEIQGLKIYTNVRDIPGSLDYVICCIPAPSAPQLIKDCAAKGVKVVHLLTAGFSEDGTEEGRRLEAEICDIARQGGVRLIGPNCMGVYCPKTGLSFAPDFPRESGSVAFISQSGGNAMYFTRLAAQRGVYFSKAVSYGNACDVDESDVLEYLMADPETDMIAAYIEGVKDGKRFSRILKEVTRMKPVVMIKGGRTEAGGRAAASHTGALAGSVEVWNGLLRQTGVISVPTLEELADALVTFLHLRVPQGRRLGTIGIGGGATVVAADNYVSAGFVLPSLPQEMQQKLRGIVPSDVGLSLNNPVDISGQFEGADVYPVVRAVADYSGIDILVFHLPLSIVPIFSSFPEGIATSILDAVIRAHNETTKPMAVVINNFTDGESWQTALNCQRKCQEAGIPVYFSINSAASAIDRFLRYHENWARLTG